MYYFYDCLLNFTSEEEILSFYEWEEKDALDFVKKIPTFRVSSKTIQDNYLYKLKYNKELLEQIKGKTITRQKEKELVYVCLLSDSKDAIALEFDKNGNVISRSKLLLEDEISLNDIMFTMKEINLSYEIIEKRKINMTLRQIREMKNIIRLEIDTLYQEKNSSKLKYLYYEWFDKRNDNLKIMYEEMIKDLNNPYHIQLKKIYNFIKLSYKKV